MRCKQFSSEGIKGEDGLWITACLGRISSLQCFPELRCVLSWLVPCQVSPGIGGLPLLREEGHGMAGGTLPFTSHSLVQGHSLKEGEREGNGEERENRTEADVDVKQPAKYHSLSYSCH